MSILKENYFTTPTSNLDTTEEKARFLNRQSTRRQALGLTGLGALSLLAGREATATWKEDVGGLQGLVGSGDLDIRVDGVKRFELNTIAAADMLEARIGGRWVGTYYDPMRAEVVDVDEPIRAGARNLWFIDLTLVNKGDNMVAEVEADFTAVSRGEEYTTTRDLTWGHASASLPHSFAFGHLRNYAALYDGKISPTVETVEADYGERLGFANFQQHIPTTDLRLLFDPAGQSLTPELPAEDAGNTVALEKGETAMTLVISLMLTERLSLETKGNQSIYYKTPKDPIQVGPAEITIRQVR